MRIYFIITTNKYSYSIKINFGLRIFLCKRNNDVLHNFILYKFVDKSNYRRVLTVYLMCKNVKNIALYLNIQPVKYNRYIPK